MINNHSVHGEWKIQLTMQINLISSDIREFCTMHSKSDNAKIMMGIQTDDIINELFEPFLKRYQEGLETIMREGSNFVFESVDLLYYSLDRISFNRGVSYIDSLSWIKHKRGTINPKSEDNKCLRDSIITALNYEKINSHPEKSIKSHAFYRSI